MSGAESALAVANTALAFLCVWLARRARPAPPRVVVRTGKELSPRELQSALCVGEDHALWRAVHQLAEAQIEDAVAETLDPDHQGKPHLLNYYAGAAAHLGRFQAFLIEERAKGLRAVDDAD